MSELKGSSVDDFLRFRKACLDDDNWKVYSKEENTICYQGIKVESGYFCMKAITELFVDYDIMQIFDFLNDEEFRGQWDSLLLNRKIIETIDDCNSIIHYTTKIPMISDRDYIYYKSCWMSDDKDEFIIFNKSTTHPDYPETSKYVRAYCAMSGYMVKKNKEGKPIFYYLVNNAFGGWVPTWVMNSLISSQGYSLMKKLATCCKNYPEWKNEHNPSEKAWREMKDKVEIKEEK
ncbi:Phosphatidylcholine transfer protein [Entamoeba marina]